MSQGSLLRRWCSFLSRIEAQLLTLDNPEARELVLEIQRAKDTCYGLMQPDTDEVM